MGMKDKAKDLKDKAMDAMGSDENIDKAADKADELTGNKASEHIDKGADMAKDARDRMNQQP